jgi:EpsI family protein
MTSSNFMRTGFSIHTRRAMLASLFMTAASIAAHKLTPTTKLANLNGSFHLESSIPHEFGNWKVDASNYIGVINPQTEQLIKATYSQTLSRTYIDNHNNRIMLSIAYGDDQTNSGSEVHHPEVCYPAQGFSLNSQKFDSIPSQIGDIRVKRLETSLGSRRFEPVTYWITIGDQIALTGIEKKLAELRHGIHGEIVDGLLFRVSTIDQNSARAYSIQDEFIRELIPQITISTRQRIFGKTNSS